MKRDHVKAMQRIVEQPSDTGTVFEGSRALGRVHYHLSVFRQFSDNDNETVAPYLHVEGHITPLDRADLAALRQRHSELTLHLADGRVLNFALTDDRGRIRSTGRGLSIDQQS